MSNLVERVVSGKKAYNWLDRSSKDAVHQLVQPGTRIKVTPNEAKAFSHCLVVPAVAEAEAKAIEALAEAKAAEEEANAKGNAQVPASADATGGSAKAGGNAPGASK